MSKTKEITPHQYAKYLNCSEANVSKHLRNNNMKFLPDIIDVKRWSRFYVLVVSAHLTIPD